MDLQEDNDEDGDDDLHPADQYERYRELAENRGWGTLRRRELDAVGSKLAAETGLPHLTGC
ncbi:hypothetical protein [Bosea vestrisii]|uniref:Uncharacterized protein n=1 Tax=Bosea vestrisii TaxID=151416 RepID=A0ABW0HGM5_9HYPH